MRTSWGSVDGLGALLLFKWMGAVECGLGSGNVVPTGQLQDGTSVRIRASVNGRGVNGRDPSFGGGGEDDGTDISPTFDSEGVVKGRIEVKPSGETAWGTIDEDGWDDTD
ncbi:hypothetical protein TrLO_g15670 [Triparma laevis f. longispina]|uniref:SRCR domain-containing protein n=1 Tax=Triparma laevis f. longispina TaxID=1714387 RepID=A0A9W7FUU4_9STRA|nr:hypothetical protein TrLO_g15670 [Triparma laevis f. longispina]